MRKSRGSRGSLAALDRAASVDQDPEMQLWNRVLCVQHKAWRVQFQDLLEVQPIFMPFSPKIYYQHRPVNVQPYHLSEDHLELSLSYQQVLSTV
ncbi:Hypothetical predicted protein [Prunus dulcis]|uniref:Uncharacterized protein n=1 Tax=Prunus dulcis TaxID=3755 RepID=A0A5E4ERS8_PRUDU|nr:Hypothetical predicted protein [Prunus dulcis]